MAQVSYKESQISSLILTQCLSVPNRSLTTDLETIINWIAHPFEMSELILKPEYL